MAHQVIFYLLVKNEDYLITLSVHIATSVAQSLIIKLLGILSRVFLKKNLDLHMKV